MGVSGVRMDDQHHGKIGDRSGAEVRLVTKRSKQRREGGGELYFGREKPEARAVDRRHYRPALEVRSEASLMSPGLHFNETLSFNLQGAHYCERQ